MRLVYNSHQKTYSRSSENVNWCPWITIWLIAAAIANLQTHAVHLKKLNNNDAHWLATILTEICYRLIPHTKK